MQISERLLGAVVQEIVDKLIDGDGLIVALDDLYANAILVALVLADTLKIALARSRS